MKQTNLLLNMQMLSDYLEDIFSEYFFYQNRDTMKLEDVRLYYGQDEVYEHYVYIVTPQYLSQALKINCNLIIVGQTEELMNSPYNQIPMIHIMKGDISHVLEAVQNIFFRFRCWTNQLNQLLINGATLYDFCAVSDEIFQNPMYIFDENGDALVRTTYVSGMMYMPVDPDSGRLLLSAEKRHLHSRDYSEMCRTRGAKYWTPEWNKYRDIYINIYSASQQYLGRILICELRSSFKPSQLKLLEFFCGYILEALKAQKRAEISTENQMQKLISEILFQKLDDESIALEKLAQKGWHQEDCYLFACASLPSSDSVFAYSVCVDIRESLNDSIAFAQNEKLYVICHLPGTTVTPESYYSLLHKIGLRDGLHFGASDLFFNLLQLPEYEKQAVYGRKFGLRKEADRHCHPFSAVALEYLFTNAVGEMPLHIACAPAIRILKRIDKEKNTDYYNTLKEYIKTGCQPVQAAKALYLHRGTLSYRLKRIQTFTDLDLEDSDTVFYLDLSFRMFECFEQK